MREVLSLIESGRFSWSFAREFGGGLMLNVSLCEPTVVCSTRKGSASEVDSTLWLSNARYEQLPDGWF
jgi:hypothetical protein